MVKKFALPLTFAIFDDDIVVVAIKTDEHSVITWYKQAFVVKGLIVDVILGIITVVEIKCALIVFSFRPLRAAIVTNHPYCAIVVVDVVLAVGFDVVVEAGLRDVDLVVFVTTKVES